MLGIVLIALPILFSLAILPLIAYPRLVCPVGVVLLAVQATILVSMPGQAQVPGLGLVLSVSGLSTILLLGIYAALAIQFIYVAEVQQGESFYSLLLIFDAAVTAAMLLSRQLVVAGLILAAALVVIVYAVAGRARDGSALDAVLKMLVAATLAAVAFVVSTLLIDAYNSTHDPNTIRVVAALLSVGMGVVVGIFPLNLWLPRLGEVAPPMVTVWVVGYVGAAALALMVSSAEVYPWLYSVDRTGELMRWTGAAAAVVAGYLALTSTSVSRLVVFSAASNVGVGIVGLASGSANGFTGVSYLILNHILATCLLLMAVGLLQTKGPVGAGSKPAPTEVGKARGFDLATIGLLVGGLAIAGVPPLGGFAGRWLVYQAAGVHSAPLVGVLLLASALVAVAYVRCVPASKTVLDEPVEGAERLRPPEGQARLWAQVSVAALAVVVLALGVFPAQLLTIIGATIATFPGLG